MIPHDHTTIIRARQLAIRREIDRRSIALKAVSYDSGIQYDTLLTYFPAEGSREPAQIPGGAIFALCAGSALPADLLSILLPDGWQIVRAPESLNHDELCEIAEQYTTKKMAAHHPESEAGREIGPNEERELTGVVVQLAARVAA
jgi:hypothetical protein